MSKQPKKKKRCLLEPFSFEGWNCEDICNPQINFAEVWAEAAQAFGGNPGGRAPKGRAALGYGKKATGNNLAAELANFSRGAGIGGAEALALAMDEVGRDMQQYADKRVGRALNQ
jgi:hypothetical protein